MKHIVIIGGGVNGLASAVKLAEHFYDNVQITLISEALSPDTTGDGSAGLWGPYYCGTTPDEKIVKWSSETHEFFGDLWSAGLANDLGVCLQPVLRLTTNSEGYPKPSWQNIVYGCEKLSEQQLRSLSAEHKRNYTGGFHFVSFTCEPVKLLPYLFKRFESVGGKFQRRKVNNIDDLLNNSSIDLIVNCTGLGARHLVKDDNVTPIRGQVARVKAPWMYQVILDDSEDGNYIIPNSEDVVLGGTHTSNDYNTKVNKDDSEFIFVGCCNMAPSLQHGIVENEWVGLRPGRNTVRIELEKYRTDKGKTIPIIHNYGHGGCGVTLAWGCATDVVELAKQSLTTNSKL